MGKIYEAMIDFFASESWAFTRGDDDETLQMGFSGKNGRWLCVAKALEDTERFLFDSILSVNAPENRRTEVALFLTYANYGLIIPGGAQMDLSDGEVRFCTCVDVEGERLTRSLIRSVVHANLVTTDRYVPGVMSVIYGRQSALSAIHAIEGDIGQAAEGLDEADLRAGAPAIRAGRWNPTGFARPKLTGPDRPDLN
jgi:hypothetical protein